MPRFLQKILTSVTAHPWLKLVSLLLAVIVWSYVKTEGF